MKPELEQLMRFLEKEELSAPQLAKKMRCALPTVYRRLYALAREGVLVVQVHERRSAPGPTPARFRLARTSSVVDSDMALRP